MPRSLSSVPVLDFTHSTGNRHYAVLAVAGGAVAAISIYEDILKNTVLQHNQRVRLRVHLVTPGQYSLTPNPTTGIPNIFCTGGSLAFRLSLY
ncbi:MAG: hypothetical protein WA364_12270, partial [Candidatus Nitrosopolaris sp.]